jgi:cobalt/nickel transport system permease protein
MTFELFSDIFASRANALARIDARAKLVIGLSAILAVIMSTWAALPAAMFVCCLTAMLALRLPAKLLLTRLAPPMMGACVLIALMALTSGATPLFAFSAGGFHLAATEEGLLRGLLMGSRVMGSVGVILLMSFVTPAHQIFRALHWFRVSEGWIEIAMLMYRYTFMLAEQVSDISSAQRVRLGYSGLRQSLWSMGTLAGAVIVRSIDQATNTHEAMIVRGYDGSMPLGSMPPMRTVDRWLMCILPFFIITVYVLVEWRLFT